MVAHTLSSCCLRSQPLKRGRGFGVEAPVAREDKRDIPHTSRRKLLEERRALVEFFSGSSLRHNRYQHPRRQASKYLCPTLPGNQGWLPQCKCRQGVTLEQKGSAQVPLFLHSGRREGRGRRLCLWLRNGLACLRQLRSRMRGKRSCL